MSEALLASLRARAVNHKFHYVSYKQSRQWTSLFARYSPFNNDPDCLRMYEESCCEAARQLAGSSVHTIGLGCGSGSKDLKLLQYLRDAGSETCYTPVDVSMPLVVMAHGQAMEAGVQTSPGVVCDLLSAPSLVDLAPEVTASSRLITFFGMLPNFEPAVILPRIAAMLGSNEPLLLSANLAPGNDYDRAVRNTLPQYANRETEEWLLTFLTDLGVNRNSGQVLWRIEKDPRYSALQRLSAFFAFEAPQTIGAEHEQFIFAAGDEIRLFFSYRYSADLLKAVLADHNINVRKAFVSGDESVLLCEGLD